MSDVREILYISPPGLSDEQVEYSDTTHIANVEVLDSYLDLIDEWILTFPFTKYNPEPPTPADPVVALIQEKVRVVYDLCKEVDEGDDTFIDYKLTDTYDRTNVVFVRCNYRFACKFIICGFELL